MADKILEFLESAAANLQSKEVLVGFIDGATYPDGTSVADVAYQNEFGEPARNQPPRPFFRNAIAAKQDDWESQMVAGLRSGTPTANVMEVMGAVIAADVRQSIIELYDPPLAKFTIEKRRERGNESTKPLEDTKIMLNDVHYEVRDLES